MKGLKALAAALVATGLLAALIPASASAAAYKHYVACGVSRKANRRTSARRRAKRAPSSKASRRRHLHGLRQVPERQKPLRRKPRKPTGHALREQDHLDDPRHAQGHLVRQRQESRHLRLPGPPLARPPLVVVGFDTATRHRRLRLARRRGPPRVAARALPAGGPGTRPRCSARSSARPQRPAAGRRST